jgi:hypothetical protein
MGRNVSVRRGRSLDGAGHSRLGLINGLAAIFAELGSPAIRFAAVRTGRFEPHSTVVAKDRIRQILALTLQANHNGNQSQLGCIVPNSIKPQLGVHSERSKLCIVPGYVKSKVRRACNCGDHKELAAAIKERPFREDLYCRLKVIHIQMPSLREVPKDLTGLANHFLNKYCRILQTDLNSSMN